MNPQSARWHFKFRSLVNFFCILVGFAVVSVIASFMQGGFLIIILAIGVAYFLFFHVLANRVIGMTCPHCFGHVATNAPWVCRSCGTKNQNTDEFPFIHRCEHCKAEPKAYICHHNTCGKPIFFTPDTDARLAAVSYTQPSPPPPEPKVQRQAERETLLHEIEMAELAGRLDAINQRKKFTKEKTPQEEIEESFNKYFASRMGAQEFARRQKMVIKEKYPNDSDMQERAIEAIDAWLISRC